MKKENYLSPTVEVIEIQLEGLLCESIPSKSNNLPSYDYDDQAW